ncbi:MAG: hypothetical protein J6S67_00630 [Methanobrevibacter sp.]|nr:hypothetical protein [Methanobrevibacter sp.]
MKKLIPSVILLLISAVLLATSSYAWFSMNTEVTATGMQVQAATSKNLLIKGASDSDFSEVGTNDSSTKELVPVSVNCPSNASLTSKTFYKLKTADGVDYDSGVMTSGTTELQSAIANTDYRVCTFTVRVDGKSGDKFDHLYVSSVTVTDTSNAASSADISKALRVGVTDGGATYIFAPVTGGAYTGGKSVSAYTDEGKVTTFADQSLSAVGLATADFGQILQGTDKTITVFVWYEGNDINCTSANSVNVETLKVSVTLSGSMD